MSDANGRNPCRQCGRRPTAYGNFTAHQGIVIMMRNTTLAGYFCRDCGLATFRDYTASTLVQGWWGPLSLIVTPFTVLHNLWRRRKFTDLPAPDPATRPAAAGSAPFDPGRPLHRRPEIAGLLVPVVIVGLAAIAVVNRPGILSRDCLQIVGDEATVVRCNQEHNGKIIKTRTRAEDCPAETDLVFRRSDSDGYYCVQEL